MQRTDVRTVRGRAWYYLREEVWKEVSHFTVPLSPLKRPFSLSGETTETNCRMCFADSVLPAPLSPVTWSQARCGRDPSQGGEVSQGQQKVTKGNKTWRLAMRMLSTIILKSNQDAHVFPLIPQVAVRIPCNFKDVGGQTDLLLRKERRRKKEGRQLSSVPNRSDINVNLPLLSRLSAAVLNDPWAPFLPS